MKKYIHYYIIVMAIALLSPMVLLSQPVGGEDPEGAPIDGGLSLLIVTGAGYGLKKLKERKINAVKE